MLRKMYLVSADQFHRPAKKKTQRRGPYEKWVKFREMFHEDMGRRTRIKAVADLLKQVLPHSTTSSSSTTTQTVEKKENHADASALFNLR
jgi:hypothetical protein